MSCSILHEFCISEEPPTRFLINDDIDAIVQRGEERTAELNSKYEGLNLEDLNNFKSDATVQQWEGEDFRPGVRFFDLRCSLEYSES